MKRSLIHVVVMEHVQKAGEVMYIHLLMDIQTDLDFVLCSILKSFARQAVGQNLY